MKRIITTPENEGTICDDADLQLLTPEGEWGTATAFEELLQQVGLTPEDYYRNNYE